MKIEWLNDELTEARLTRGWLWWKRVALVRRSPDRDAKPITSELKRYWYYPQADIWCTAGMEDYLERAQWEYKIWRRPTKIPAARLLSDKSSSP